MDGSDTATTAAAATPTDTIVTANSTCKSDGSILDVAAEEEAGGDDIGTDMQTDMQSQTETETDLLLARLASQFGDLDVHQMVLGGIEGGDTAAAGANVQVIREEEGVLAGIDRVEQNEGAAENTMEENDVKVSSAGCASSSPSLSSPSPTPSATRRSTTETQPRSKSGSRSRSRSSSVSSSSSDCPSSSSSSSSSGLDEPTPEELAAWQAAQHSVGQQRHQERQRELRQQHPVIVYRKQLQEEIIRNTQTKNSKSAYNGQENDEQLDVSFLLTGEREYHHGFTTSSTSSSFLLRDYHPKQQKQQQQQQRQTTLRYLENLLKNGDTMIMDTRRLRQPWKRLMTSELDGLSFEALWHAIDGYAGPIIVFMNVTPAASMSMNNNNMSEMDIQKTTGNSSTTTTTKTTTTTTTTIGFMTTETWQESPVDPKSKLPQYFGTGVVGNNGGSDVGIDGDNCFLFGWTTVCSGGNSDEENHDNENFNNDEGISIIRPRSKSGGTSTQQDYADREAKSEKSLMYCYRRRGHSNRHHNHFQSNHHHHHQQNNNINRHNHHHNNHRNRHHQSPQIVHGLGIGGTGNCYQVPRLHITESFTDCTANTYDVSMEPGPILPHDNNNNNNNNFVCHKFDISDVEVWGIGGSKWIDYALEQRQIYRNRQRSNQRRHVQAGAKAAFGDHQLFTTNIN